MELEPYLHFDGTCEEALRFYKKVFAGEITSTMRFGEAPTESEVPPGYADKIMHANFVAPVLKFMASDGRPGTTRTSGSRVSLALSTRDLDEAERVFKMLGTGGEVTLPLHDMSWGARFGMLTDKYGVDWMINAPKS